MPWSRTRRRPTSTSDADDLAAIESDLDVESDVVLVAFGGLAGSIGMPPFEFFRLAGQHPIKKVFVRDLRQAWYHLGISEAAPSFEGMVEELDGLLGACGARRAVFFGNSLGGYAALAAGRMLAVGETHAFSPQTFLSSALRRQHGDDRWAEHIARVHDRRPPVPDELLDLAELFARIDAKAGVAHVHYGAAYRLDTAHARRLAESPGVQLHPYEDADHDLVRRLRADGRLQAILEGAIA